MSDLVKESDDLLSMPEIPDTKTSFRRSDLIEFRISDVDKEYRFERDRWTHARCVLLEEVTKRGLCVSEWRDEERRETVFWVQRFPTSCDLSYARLMLMARMGTD